MFSLEKTNLSLGVSISMSMLEVFWTDGMTNESLVVLENNIFANSLINTTIQDSGKRERSD